MRFVPIRLGSGDGVVGRAAASREPVQSRIFSTSATYAPRMRQLLERFGYPCQPGRSACCAKTGSSAGLVVRRKSAASFAPK